MQEMAGLVILTATAMLRLEHNGVVMVIFRRKLLELHVARPEGPLLLLRILLLWLPGARATEVGGVLELILLLGQLDVKLLLNS